MFPLPHTSPLTIVDSCDYYLFPLVSDDSSDVSSSTSNALCDLTLIPANVNTTTKIELPTNIAFVASSCCLFVEDREHLSVVHGLGFQFITNFEIASEDHGDGPKKILENNFIPA